ncbi:MAG: hypothetical protein H6713_41185 [Myxococcales bacterium]|nr:hypothetical protein [Myxococcales bacterium]
MGLVITIAAAVGLLAAGMALFAFARTRGARAPAAAAGRERRLARALASATLSHGLSDILARPRALKIELEAIALYARQFAGVGDAVELPDARARGRRRPLWHRLEGASFDYAVARAGDGLREWLARHDALEPLERAVLERLNLDAAPIRELLRRDLQREDQDPAALTPALSRVRATLERFELELRSYSPQAYR